MRGTGELIAGRYLVTGVLGSGGEGAVYLAEDTVRGTVVAVKEYFFYRKSREVVMQEAERLRKLSHPALPKLLQVACERDTICLVTEYIQGESLRALLGREGHLPEETVRQVAVQLCAVLSYLHTRKPPVHYLDLKPSNILLDQEGQVHLIDFGSEASLTRGYAAPEQYLSGSVLDARTDLYALGVTLHFLLTGKNPNQAPFIFEKIRKLNPKITKETAELVERLLLPAPEERWQSAEELRQALLGHSGKRRQALKRFLVPVLAAGVLTFTAVPVFLQGSKAEEAATITNEPPGQSAPVSDSITAARRNKREPSFTLSLPPGEYESYRLLTVDYDPAEGKLYYTTDGQPPDEHSSLYRDGIVLSAPSETVRLRFIGFDGKEREESAQYRITALVEEIPAEPDRKVVWDIYYALGKPWTEPLYNYELAKLRELPEEDLTEEDRWLTEYMPFLR